jgi:capsular polysaccharide transport system permease protein
MRPGSMQLSERGAQSGLALFLRSPWIERLRSLVVLPAKDDQGLTGEPRLRRLPPVVHKYRFLLLFVALPTFLTALYLVLFAADQYESEAHFYVIGGSGGSSGSSSAGPVGALLNGSGATSKAEEETLAVLDYFNSHDAVRDLRRNLDLPGVYRRPEADILGRLSKDATAEQIYKYLYVYFPKIDAYIDFNNGVGVLKVRGFRPEDSQAVTESMLNSGEKLMDDLSKRVRDQILELARSEVKRAEARVAEVSGRITDFRLHHESIDPNKSSETVLGVIGSLEGNLAKVRSDMKAKQAYLKPDSSEYLSLVNQIAGLEAEIDSQRRRLTGADGSMAPTVEAYDNLIVERQFAEQDYTSALASLETARISASQQHYYLVRIVEPNKAEQSEYPRRLVIIITVFFGLWLIYGILNLIVSGIREHAS